MPQHQARRAGDFSPSSVEVGSAQSGDDDPNQHLFRVLDSGFGEGLDPDPTRIFEQSFHSARFAGQGKQPPETSRP